MRQYLLAVLYFSTVLVGCFILPSPARCAEKNDRIVGTWQMKLVNGCKETYTFRADGVRTYNSAQEEGESKYSIASTPSTLGFYKFTDVITKSNGKPDCSSHTAPVGDSITAFLFFNANGNSFEFCSEEVAKSCVGPFVRVAG